MKNNGMMLVFCVFLAVIAGLGHSEVILRHSIAKYEFKDGMFEIPNIITIYDIGNIGYEMYNMVIRHELQHYYCYVLFENADFEHNRCF